MNATIRKAGVGDEGVLASLNAFVQDLHLEKRPADFKTTNIAELTATYRSVLEASTGRAWIADSDGRPVGYVLAVIHRRNESPLCPARQWLEVDEIAVDPEFRRRGIGRALMLGVISEANALGVANIEATSWAFNEETHELLRGVGFVTKTVRFEFTASGR
ncbi:MAG: GNAT family N-acetyltransferase [Acidobacteria bacterium]|nr:GNAT family N-acetyltransferase [Acidobacteriota bacterium]